jgi:predicted 3-demethylubiquinone-9 3-methyltransferase (glyoxalase superfamily)
MTPFTTCLWYDTQAEDAATFYCGIFKDSSLGNVQRLPEGQAIVVEFTLNGQHFMGLNGGPQHKFTEAVSFVIHCADQAEVDYYWDALLADGGQPDACGWLKDKYGMSWQVVPDRLFELMQDPERGQAVFQAMMQMVKLDIAPLEKAFAGE